jgi:alpha-1,2-mannosyltransferase
MGAALAGANMRLDRRIVSGPMLPVIAGASVAICVAIALYGVYHRIAPYDFEVYLMGARHGFTPDLYSIVTRDAQLPFTYPPFAAWLFLPLVDIPFGIAEGLWAVATIASLVATVGFSIRLVRPEIDRARVWTWAAALSLPCLLLEPVFRTQTLGQVNLLLLFPVLWDLGEFRSTGRRTLPVGVATGITAAVKLIPLIFIPYLLLIRRTRAALVCAATFAACEVIAFAGSPHSSWEYWSKIVLDTKRFAPINFSYNQSVLASLGRFAHESLSSTVGLGASALAGLIGLLVAAWAYRRSSVALGLLVAGASSMLASPITWTHHMVWVIPIVVWLVIGSDRPAAGSWLAAGTALLFWISPIGYVPKTAVMCPCEVVPELHETAWQLGLGNSYFFATVAFVAGVAVMLAVRDRRHPHDTRRVPTPAVT